MSPGERDVIAYLLRSAAAAWAAGSVRTAERLVAGAWHVTAGREYVDADDERERSR